MDKFIVPSKHLVLDPMCGSGVTLLACARLGVRAIGSDISESCVKTARERIESEFKRLAAMGEQSICVQGEIGK